MSYHPETSSWDSKRVENTQEDNEEIVTEYVSLHLHTLIVQFFFCYIAEKKNQIMEGVYIKQ